LPLFFHVGIIAFDATASPQALRALSIPAIGRPLASSTPSCSDCDLDSGVTAGSYGK